MMKFSSFATSLGALCFLVTGALATAPLTSRALPTPTVQEQIDLEKFLEDFHRAMEIKATAEMANITRRNPEAALFLIIDYGERISIQSNEILETDMAAFIAAWKSAFNSDFGLIMYEYFSLMKVQVRSFRGQRIGDFKVFERDYQKAIAAKDWAALDLSCERYEVLAGAFVKAGDHYYASECWRRAAVAYDEGVRGNAANIEKAGQAYAEVVTARKRIELEDQHYSNAKSRSDQLLGQLKDSGKGAARGKGEAEGDFTRKLAGVSLSEAVTIPLEFEMYESLKGPFRPAYHLTDITPIWSGFNFGKPGTTSNILSYQSGPQGIRSSGGVMIDTNRDGTGDLEVAITGNVEPVEFTIGEGDAERKWGFLTQLLGNDEIYQGIGMNMGVSEQNMSLYIAPAATMKGEIDGVPFRVIDDNVDGTYGSQPQYWGLWGLSGGSVQPEYDTIVVDEGKRAQPWSEYVKVGESWYQIRSVNFGKEITASKAKLETGMLKLDFKGPKPDFLIVRGANTFEFCFYDVLAGGKKGIEVPAGDYSLLAGGLVKGKRKQAMKALILPSVHMKLWTVKPGESTTIEMGAPFGFSFTTKDSSRSVKIKGESVVVTGKAGERYERLWNCSTRPDAQMRKAGTRKSGRTESMPVILDRDSLFDAGFGAAWFPLDLELTKKKQGEEVEIMLIEKKNKLFGEIVSEWKNSKN